MTRDTPTTRPAIRWHGGKWRLAPWIISHLPPHRVYVEPFGGGASVLLRKSRSHVEVYNDLDRHAVNLFRVLRNTESAAQLIELLHMTPFARDEFTAANEPTDDPVEAARRLIIRSFMGFGSGAASGPSPGNDDTQTMYRSTGFRAACNRKTTTPADDWANYSRALPVLINRLRGVVIENRDSIEVMSQHDGPETLHYVDPPYLHETRSQSADGRLNFRYRHEVDASGHRLLLQYLLCVRGMVVLSGYPSNFYDESLAGWRRVERVALADGARKRIEVLWINSAAAAAAAAAINLLL